MLRVYGNDASYQLAESKDLVGGSGGTNVVTSDYIVTVGKNGDYATLNDALEALSRIYPAYRKGGIKCEAKILSGTVISEQIAVVGIDLSYITITSADAVVNVDVSGFTSQGLNSHDLRENNGAFIGGESSAGLPTIGCVFHAVNTTKNVVGYFANRGSRGVVLSNCGFDGFRDGVISNNESSVTIREGIATNNARWGVHARHNGEISARSCNLSGNGTYGAYADRIAHLDVREAIINNCQTAIDAENCSGICATGAHSTGCKYVAKALTKSLISCNSMEIVNPTGAMFTVASGGELTCHTTTITNDNEVSETNIPKNTLHAYGIIWG